MTKEDYEYFEKYKNGVNKFIFTEGALLLNRDYIKLTDEVRKINKKLNVSIN